MFPNYNRLFDPNCKLIFFKYQENKREPLFVATLDVQKAFDVVNHELLLRKLYLNGITGNDWLLVQDIYSDMTTSVKWESHLSAPFVIRQGVRQGGVLSTSHYKRYNNPHLIVLEDRYTGMVIGSICVPHITVADDTALITNSEDEMQGMVEDTGESANQEQYVIHPTKSEVLLYSNGVKSTCDQLGFDMGGKRIKFESQCNHLGIFRDIKQKVNIEEKISLGRKTAYALMGAGLHSGNGLTKPLCAYLWSTYVIPRVVYGLEVQKLSRTDMESLEKFQRKCLRQIQGLPDKTPNCVTLSLLGIPPVELIIHKNILNLFVSSVSSKDSVEYDIIERQLVMKSLDKSSWCNEVKRILKQYDLPSAYELFVNTPSKEKWKTLLNSKMNSYLETVWEQEIYSKKSLKYLNPRSVTVGKLHMCWSSVRHNVRDNRRAELKVKVLTGAYILQANRSCFNQYAVDPSYKLCLKEPEDREHFIARCDSLEHVRKPYRQKFNMIFNNIIPSQSIDSIVFTKLVLDCSMVVHGDVLEKIDSHKVELYSRELLSELHYTRIGLLNKQEGKTAGQRS